MDSSQPQQPQAPVLQVNTPEQLQQSRGAGSKRNIFLIGIVILFLLIIAGGIGYYAGVYKAQSAIKQTTQNIPKTLEKTSTRSAIPIPPQSQYEVIDGSLYKVTAVEPFLDNKLVLDKLKEETEYGEGLNETSLRDKLYVSPDGSKIIFFASSSVNYNVIFYMDVISHKVIPVGIRMDQLVVWSPDSRYIASIAPVGDAGINGIVTIFDTRTNENVVRIHPSGLTLYHYTDLRWTGDSRKVFADYNVLDENEPIEIIDRGLLEIPLK